MSTAGDKPPRYGGALSDRIRRPVVDDSDGEVAGKRPSSLPADFAVRSSTTGLEDEAV